MKRSQASCARARRVQRAKGLSLIAVDYLQLMFADRRAENRQNEVADISPGLKLLAAELNVPILALSQLSRGVDHRENNWPNLSDLRDSGAIEHEGVPFDS